MKWCWSWLAILFFVSPLVAGVREPGFDTCMRTDGNYEKYLARHPREWKRMKALFQTYQKKKAHLRLSKAQYRIPKKIHLIWLGSPPPEFVQKMVLSWKTAHPSWQVKLWTDEDVWKFHLKNQQAYDRAKNWGERSDIFRYEILEREGGIHADTDFECIKPFDDICKTADFFAGIGYSEGAPFVYNGLIGCRPGHPIIKRCVNTLPVGNGDNDFLRIITTTGPAFLTKCFQECLWPAEGEGQTPPDVGSVVAFPVTYFYPFPDSRRASYASLEAVKRDWVCPETYAIHYWKISWLP